MYTQAIKQLSLLVSASHNGLYYVFYQWLVPIDIHQRVIAHMTFSISHWLNNALKYGFICNIITNSVSFSAALTHICFNLLVCIKLNIEMSSPTIAICCNLFVYGFNCIWFLFSIWWDPFTPGPNKAVNIPSLFDPWEKEEAVNPFPGTHNISSCIYFFQFFSYWKRFSSVDVMNSKSTVLQISKTQTTLIVWI